MGSPVRNLETSAHLRCELTATLDFLRTETRADIAMFGILDPRTMSLAVWSDSYADNPAQGIPVPLVGMSPCVKVLMSGKIHAVPDIRLNPPEEDCALMRAEELISVLGAPVILHPGDRPCAIASVMRRTPHDWDAVAWEIIGAAAGTFAAILDGTIPPRSLMN